MKKILIVLFCWNALISSAKEACYLADGLPADLFFIKMNRSKTVKRGIIFKENITDLSKEKRKKMQPWIDETFQPVRHLPLKETIAEPTDPKTIRAILNPSSFASLTQFDTLEINGELYYLSYSFSDDGFVGGSPNQINRQVFVQEIGVVYSYSNYMNAHSLLMLFHKDETKQKALTEIYKHFEKHPNPGAQGVYWKKISELIQAYSFEKGLTELKNRWGNTRNDIQLVSSQSKVINGQIHYTATIQNVSNKPYFFPLKVQIAPSLAHIHYEDSTKSHNWDLLNTYYGRHFKRIEQPTYLEVGDTISFSQIVPTRIGCGGCTHLTYSGFQIYRYRLNFFRWLFSDSVIFYDKTYFIYPFREIR